MASPTSLPSFVHSFKNQAPTEGSPRVLRTLLLFSAVLAVVLLIIAFYLIGTAGLVDSVNESDMLNLSFKALNLPPSSLTISGVIIMFAAFALLIQSGLLLSVLYLHSPQVMVKDTIATIFAEEVEIRYSSLTKFGGTKDWLEVAQTTETEIKTDQDVVPVEATSDLAKGPAGAQPIPATSPQADTTEQKMRLGPKKKKKKKRSVKPAYYIPQEG